MQLLTFMVPWDVWSEGKLDEADPAVPSIDGPRFPLFLYANRENKKDFFQFVGENSSSKRLRSGNGCVKTVINEVALVDFGAILLV